MVTRILLVCARVVPDEMHHRFVNASPVSWRSHIYESEIDAVVCVQLRDSHRTAVCVDVIHWHQLLSLDGVREQTHQA